MITNIPFKSKNKNKKFSVYAYDGKRIKLIHFGAKGYSDYTIHKDIERKKRYINRHSKNENWDKSGLFTAGFWSRYILWNRPTFKESLNNTISKFNLKTIKLNKL